MSRLKTFFYKNAALSSRFSRWSDEFIRSILTPPSHVRPRTNKSSYQRRKNGEVSSSGGEKCDDTCVCACRRNSIV